MPGDSKTEKATPKKRRDERKEGHVVLSKDVISVVFIFGAFYSLKLLFPGIYEDTRGFMLRMLGMISGETALGSGDLEHLAYDFALTAVNCLVPIMLICMALGILATGVQTKFLFSQKSMTPNFGRLSPLKGIKNLFSIKNLVELLKSILKVTIMVWILYTILRDDFVSVARTLDMDVKAAIIHILSLIIQMVLKVALIFLVIAVFDYFFQRWQYEREIRMSKQDIKEEHKQTEGNPEIKGKIRQLQRERAMSRMMQAVPEADVIIRNPTHFAVALRYKLDQDEAPILLAKGQDNMAFRIIETGQEHEITVVENRALARGIYQTTELNQQIPADYYGAVAEILVYVYKLNKKDGVINEKNNE